MQKDDVFATSTEKGINQFVSDLGLVAKKYGFIVHNEDKMELADTFGAHGVEVEGATMQEVAFFVATRLASIESVVSTTTHFVLKTYKENHVLFEEKEASASRLVMSP